MAHSFQFPRPLRIKPSVVKWHAQGGVGFLAAAIVVVCTFGMLTGGSARDLSEQCRIWETGVTARSAMARGTETSPFIFGLTYSYTIDVSYTDESGVFHQHWLQFRTWDEMRHAAQPMVRYLRDDPDRFALNWAVVARRSRMHAIGVDVLFGVVLGGLFGLVGIHLLRERSLARRRALDSEAVVAKIVKVRNVNIGGRDTSRVFHFKGRAANGRSVAGRKSISVKEGPLLADRWGHTMVVLVDPRGPGRPLVLLSDFHPFELTPEQRAAVLSAIQACCE